MMPSGCRCGGRYVSVPDRRPDRMTLMCDKCHRVFDAKIANAPGSKFTGVRGLGIHDPKRKRRKDDPCR